MSTDSVRAVLSFFFTLNVYVIVPCDNGYSIGDGQFFNIEMYKVTWYSEIYIESTYLFIYALMWWLLQNVVFFFVYFRKLN